MGRRATRAVMGRRATRAAEFVAARFLGGWRLRTRLFALVLALVVVSTAVNFVVLDVVVQRVLSSTVENYATALARRLAEEVARAILYQDLQGLRASLAGMTRVDQHVEYAFVLDQDGDVLASSFAAGLPLGLQRANAPSGADVGSVLVNDHSILYRDVAVPILSGQLGHARLGVRLDHIEAGMRTIRLAILAMAFGFLMLGVLGSFVIAEVINAPIARLVRFARHFDPARPADNAELPLGVRGEFGEVIRSVDAMARRLRQLHAAREAFQGRIVRAERLATVGALAAGIAHEVNNPLAGMQTCLQALAREPEDVEQTRAYALMMLDASRSIERTVRVLMDSAARSQREIAEVDLSELAERVTLLLQVRFRDAGVELGVEFAPDLPPLRSDVGLLQQILVNLLLNAGDAAPRGSRVLLRVRAVKEHLVFEVLDRGPGIAAAVRERIFDAFVTTKQHSGGTGLGLAMVRSLVTNLGGTVTFDDCEGGGTRFAVSMPSTLAPASDPPPTGEAAVALHPVESEPKTPA